MARSARRVRPLVVLDDRAAPGHAHSLGAAPLVEQLAFALDHRVTGTLSLGSGDGQRNLVYLHQGVPAKARTAEVVAPLDETLVDMGVLDEETLIDTYEMACDARVLHGRMLLERGLVDAGTLVAALRRQLEAKVSVLFNLPAGTPVYFHPGTNLLCQYGGPELIDCDPHGLIMAGARQLDLHARLDESIRRIGQQRLVLAARAQPERLDLRLEAPVVDLLSTRPLSYQELLAASATSQQVVRHTLYALALAGWLEVVEETAPPSPRRPRSATPEPLSLRWPYVAPQVEARPLTPEAVFAMVDRIHDATDAEVLGVDDNASIDDIAPMYLALTRQWHPNPVGVELAALRPTVERIYGRIIDAYASLTRLHVSVPRPAASWQPAAQPRMPRTFGQDVRLRAKPLYDKALQLYRAGQLSESARLLRRSIQIQPDRPEHRTLFAWIQALSYGREPELAPGETSECFVSSIRLLDRVLQDFPGFEPARYYRAVLLRRSGHLDAAAAEFRRLVAQNPNHLDAQRELRLMKIRARRQAAR